MVNYARSAIAWNLLETSGIGGITGVWMSPVSNGTNIVVQIHKTYRGHAQQVAAALWGSGGSVWFYKHVMVVEQDIDIHDPAALDWALAYRVNAGLGDIACYGPTLGSPLDPSTPPQKSNSGGGEWTRVLVDATRSWDFEPRPEWGGRHYPALNTIDPELESIVAARWEEYGIGIPYLDDRHRELLTMRRLRSP
nr:UbiD family decarboxylase domain-containing protein [Mycobacterium gordonae]